MASNINNIYLLREETHLNNKCQHNHVFNNVDDVITQVIEPLCYVSINKTIDTYNEHILKKLNENSDLFDINPDINTYNFVNDFVVLCFLLGNDFIPHIPSINIKVNGLDYLLNAYVHMFQYTQQYLIQDNSINFGCADYPVLEFGVCTIHPYMDWAALIPDYKFISGDTERSIGTLGQCTSSNPYFYSFDYTVPDKLYAGEYEVYGYGFSSFSETGYKFERRIGLVAKVSLQ